LVLLTFALAWRRPLEWGPIPAKPEVQHAKAIPDVSAERLKDSGAMDERKEPAQKTQVTYSHKGMKSRRLPRRQPPSIQMDGKATENQRTLKDLEAETAYFEPEVATEFIPFMAVGGTFPEEQQQLVRVKLPRSALETFGLPVNRERVRDPVQADMLIGEDGLVRAIRFVH
jgi:hypothetical protein